METDKLLKIGSLGVIGIVLSFLTFNTFRNFLTNLDFGDFFLALLILLFFVVLLITEIIFVPRKKHLFWLVAIQSLIPLFIFRSFVFSEDSLLPILAIGFFLYFTLWSARKSFKDLSNSMEIRFFTIARRVSPSIVSGALIFFAIFSFHYFFQLGNFSNQTAENVFDRTLNASLPLLHSWFPDINFNMSVNEALRTMSENQLEKSQSSSIFEGGFNFQTASNSVRENLINETTNRIRSSIETVTGNLNPEQAFRDALFQVVSGKVTDLSLNTRLIIAGVVITLLFGLFRTFAWAIYIPAEIIGFLVFKLLLVSGFAKIALKTSNKEVITI